MFNHAVFPNSGRVVFVLEKRIKAADHGFIFLVYLWSLCLCSFGDLHHELKNLTNLPNCS